MTTQTNPNLRIAAPQRANEAGTLVTTPYIASLPQKRHWVLLASFLFLVIVPPVVAAAYLYGVARDQYHSSVSFSIRSEEFANPLEALGAFTEVSTSTASDVAILYDFIRSQALVERIQDTLDIREFYSRDARDIVYHLDEDASIEDLVDYWGRMISVSTDAGTAIIDIEVRAFAPMEARAIAAAIVDESTTLVNEMSQVARDDAMRFASEDLVMAQDRLSEIRQRVREFRVKNRIIDPEADSESQMGVVAELQSKLAEMLIRRESLREFAQADDQRLNTLETQIRATRKQIANERAKVADVDFDGRSLSDVVGEYEKLLVDLEFSENAYTSALAEVEQARAEARRQSRYAAVHIQPTLAEESLYPKRELLVFIVFLTALAAWSIATLIFYNVRDRS